MPLKSIAAGLIAVVVDSLVCQTQQKLIPEKDNYSAENHSGDDRDSN
jgi:hypothetical protein